ncbi:MAG: polysaccharide biosynthesis tyrosine autokinase, partial [Pseudomonadota bacterium]
DRAKSAEMADQLSRLYIQEQLEVKFAATQQATEWLTGQVTTLKDELEAAENAVKAFVTKTELVSAEALELQNRQLKDFRERLSDTEGQRDLLASRVAMLEAARGTGDAEAMADAVDDASLSAMLPALAGGSAQTRQVFQNRFNVLLERTRYDQSRAAAQVVALQRSSEALELQVAAQSAELLELEQLQREANASRLIYEYFLGRLKETSVQQGIQQADSRVLSEAVIAEGPSSPKSLALLAVAAVVGMMGGAGIAVRREMKASVFRTPEELEQETGLVVIGQVPRVPKIKRRKMLEYIATKPASAFVESVRNLRTSILLSSVDQEPRLIMVTSTVSGEGKTTQSLALAQNLASMGRKVLVVEGDIRRRTFREYFDVASDKGLIAAVTEGKPLEEYVAHNETLGIDLLFGEKTSVNAADFFSSKKFFDFLTRAREAYDFVVIDTPPVMAVPDARVIGQEADAVIYVVHWDDTPRSLVRQGLHAFNTVNVPVTGLVLSQIDAKGLQRYGYEAGYGSYASGYYDN